MAPRQRACTVTSLAISLTASLISLPGSARCLGLPWWLAKVAPRRPGAHECAPGLHHCQCVAMPNRQGLDPIRPMPPGEAVSNVVGTFGCARCRDWERLLGELHSLWDTLLRSEVGLFLALNFFLALHAMAALITTVRHQAAHKGCVRHIDDLLRREAPPGHWRWRWHSCSLWEWRFRCKGSRA